MILVHDVYEMLQCKMGTEFMLTSGCKDGTGIE
jgi:hypothetical protein